MYQLYVKRILDFSVATVLLLLLFPLFLVIGLLVRVYLGSPILFCQQRPGYLGRIFTLYKFRTMTDEKDTDGCLLPDSVRLTRFGRFLRSTSLDELPELINVLKGEMSLVGPRPLLTRYYPYFTEVERLRFTVRPGITGLAQVSGRNDLDWDARIAADVDYVKHCSLFLDIKIIISTIHQVFTRRGVQVDPESVMLNFDEERRLRLGSQAEGLKDQ
jgi:undecaprenyl phosphate N,N'-diacetylbacillosamine 1-phosphate transferase